MKNIQKHRPKENHVPDPSHDPVLLDPDQGHQVIQVPAHPPVPDQIRHLEAAPSAVARGPGNRLQKPGKRSQGQYRC